MQITALFICRLLPSVMTLRDVRVNTDVSEYPAAFIIGVF